MKKLLSFLAIIIIFTGFLIIANSEDDLSNIKEGPFKVIKVIDGDTIDLENFGRVRLSGINTPEKDECYYEEAKLKLEELVFEKEVFLERDKTDTGKYGRKLRYIYLENILINELLIKEGYARVYDKYDYDTKKYDQLKDTEKIAIENNLGVWNC